MISATNDVTSLAGAEAGRGAEDVVGAVDDDARQFSMEEETEESTEDEDDDGGGEDEDEEIGSNNEDEVEDESSFEPCKDEEGKPERDANGNKRDNNFKIYNKAGRMRLWRPCDDGILGREMRLLDWLSIWVSATINFDVFLFFFSNWLNGSRFRLR